MENKFKAITAQIGGALIPIFQVLGPIIEAILYPITKIAELFNYISSTIAGVVGFGLTLSIILGTIYKTKLKTFFLEKQSQFLEKRKAGSSIVNAIASIFGGQGSLPIIGAVIAATMVGALFSAISKAQSVGDLKMPAGQGPIVTTAEGAIYKGTKNDDVAMAPGITSQLDNAARRNNGGGVSVSSNSDSKYMALLGRVDTLMQKLTTGGIVAHAYMDTSKVTANVANNSNNNTRNNFAFGQG